MSADSRLSQTRSQASLADGELVLDREKTTMLEESDADDCSYPDGGTGAYVALMGSFLGLAINFSITNTMGSVLVYLSNNTNSSWQPYSMSLAFAFYLCITYMFAIIGGPLFDMYGPTVILIVAAVLSFVGLIGAAASDNIILLLPSFVVVSCGNSLAMTPLIATITYWFKRRRARAMGIATAGGSVAGIAFQFILLALIKLYGHDWTVCIFAFICVAIMSVLTCCVRVGMPRDVIRPGHALGWSRIKAVFRTLSPRKLRSTPYILVIFGGVFSNLSVTLAMTYFGLYVISLNKSTDFALFSLVLWNAAGIGGKIMSGYAADKIGCFNVILVVQLVYFVATVLLGISESHTMLVVYAIIAGFCLGSISSLIQVCVAKVSPVEELGSRYGFLNFWTGIAFLFVISAFTLVAVDVGGSIDCSISVIFVGTCAASGIIFWVAARCVLAGLKVNIRI